MVVERGREREAAGLVGELLERKVCNGGASSIYGLK